MKLPDFRKKWTPTFKAVTFKTTVKTRKVKFKWTLSERKKVKFRK